MHIPCGKGEIQSLYLWVFWSNGKAGNIQIITQITLNITTVVALCAYKENRHVGRWETASVIERDLRWGLMGDCMLPGGPVVWQVGEQHVQRPCGTGAQAHLRNQKEDCVIRGQRALLDFQTASVSHGNILGGVGQVIRVAFQKEYWFKGQEKPEVDQPLSQ